ncbi:MAG: SgcJ/EcaC family oxidoreductase [Candidatus Eremiobacteraeota bacterium]|nr:SgcJ/EcaC family oxidoreductase [Candidatus Eremiobacteraeota bacterium]
MSLDLETSAEALVQRQIDAYNAHDAEAFAAVYAEDMQLFDLGGDLFLFGRDALRERYAMLFANAPQIEVKIAKRIVVGDVVIDEELITQTATGVDAHVGVIYEATGGLIRRVWVTRGRATRE